MSEKQELRRKLRVARREHVVALAEATRGLLFRHPPRPVLNAIPEGSTIGLYRSMPHEAPTDHYANYFFERGHRIALPRFATRNAAMEFAEHRDPVLANDLAIGPFGMAQPGDDAAVLQPEVLFVPLVGFTAKGDRLGQGGGDYDRWLAEHKPELTIGLAWDMQLCSELPVEPHDKALDMIVTPTRCYGA